MIATKDGGIQSMADKKPKIIGVIPARYASSRFPGKPLADIHGKPMIWWVYQQAKKVAEFSEVYVATDDERIYNVCDSLEINALTTKTHSSSTDRVCEVATRIDADRYVVINGDEPILSPEDIANVAKAIDENNGVSVLCRPIRSPIEAFNASIHKIALNERNDVIYLSRTPIPYPQERIDYDVFKCVGVAAYTREMLQFCRDTPIGRLESIEGSDFLRLIENRKPIKAVVTENYSISVDTPKDLEKVRQYLTAIRKESNDG